MVIILISNLSESKLIITVLTKSSSPQLLCSQELRRSGNDQQYRSLLAQLRCNQSDMLDYRSSAVLVKGDHMQIPFKLAANL